MPYTNVVGYDPDRVPPDEVEAHVRAEAGRVFREADGYDHETIHPLLPGTRKPLPNGQTMCIVRVDCRKADGT